eukprot:CAMPEP_0183294736 /NCGR_PEP_ID=MMETSP0160_2-20130417/2948_1 /TAXON_ID=2839 ORGANISM="Odontella Sinensis, Strain Grunow 1884" /NCGR_SAMPLE_ID=MMETSP0160_2 /ASSEMBLY_ACC=CAM_ASM_000250 /LENGTH=416 /DNA_ID=CAMNT_0025456097 /DNA_START=177 /DNA_END=1423 /DNA_ORIENTATION=-
MSRQITQPVNQVRLTNVAVVRTTQRGRRFEVACYRNKIVNYRQGVETDLSEVLQIDRVFTNVAQGRFARSSDLKKAFGTSNEEEVIRTILKTGQVQISDMERNAALEDTQRTVAAMVAAKCVDPVSGRPYTTAQIRDAMRGCGFMVHPTRGTKAQFLDCVRLLRERGVLRIERAKMELRFELDDAEDDDDDGGGDGRGGEEALVARLREVGAIFPHAAPAGGDDDDDRDRGATSTSTTTFQIDPSLYRAVDSAVKGAGGRLVILRQCVTEEGEVELETELERKKNRREAAAAAAASASATATATATAQRGNSTEEEEKEEGEDEDVDDGVEALVQRTKAAKIEDVDDDNDGRSDDGLPPTPMPTPTTGAANSRKEQKKKQKKSKKQKRREKEEAAERSARSEAERVRREEREEARR